MVGDVAVYVFDINQPSLPTPFYSVLLSVSVFMALSTVFHSIKFPDNSSLSHSVLPVLFEIIGPFSYLKGPIITNKTGYNSVRLTGLKAPTD